MPRTAVGKWVDSKLEVIIKVEYKVILKLIKEKLGHPEIHYVQSRSQRISIFEMMILSRDTYASFKLIVI